MTGREFMAEAGITYADLEPLFDAVGNGHQDLGYFTVDDPQAPRLLVLVASGTAARVLVRAVRFLFGEADYRHETQREKKCTQLQ